MGNILVWKKEAFVSDNPEQNTYPPRESPDEDYLWISVGDVNQYGLCVSFIAVNIDDPEIGNKGKCLMEADMSKALSVVEWMKRGGLLLVMMSIVLTGCQGVLMTYKGTKVRNVYWIALTDGTQRSANYKSPDIAIDYQLYRGGDELELFGVAEYTPAIRNGYTLIPYFHLSVLLTDQYGNVLQEKGITTPGSDDPNNRMRFREKIHLPPKTANMAFSYKGEARSGSGRQDGGGAVSFWDVPIVK